MLFEQVVLSTKYEFFVPAPVGIIPGIWDTAFQFGPTRAFVGLNLLNRFAAVNFSKH